MNIAQIGLESNRIELVYYFVSVDWMDNSDVIFARSVGLFRTEFSV